MPLKLSAGFSKQHFFLITVYIIMPHLHPNTQQDLEIIISFAPTDRTVGTVSISQIFHLFYQLHLGLLRSSPQSSLSQIFFTLKHISSYKFVARGRTLVGVLE